MDEKEANFRKAMSRYYSEAHREEPRVPYQATTSRGHNSITEKMARIVYRGYELAGHGSQSFEKVHERGGFDVEEMIHFAFIAGCGFARGIVFGDEIVSAERVKARE